ncbi:MAG: histidinol-phosphate transaminase [Pseudobdellovibrionaceae bacterium]
MTSDSQSINLLSHVSKEILTLVPYKPGKPISETQREYGLKEVYKLASNENPLGPSPKAVEAIQKAVSSLHLYPDAAAYELTQAIHKHWKMPTQNIAFGNGSNEIIDILIRIFCEPGSSILTSDKAFVAYQVCAQAARVDVQFSPLDSGFKVNLKKMGDMIESSKNPPRIVFIPNPNNPTGTYIPDVEVKAFLERFKNRHEMLIVFDEAYVEFVRAKDYRPTQDYFGQYANLLVIRTMSKVYGLAGLRIGVLLAPQSVIELYNRVRNPFNINELAQVAARAALSDSEFIKKSQRTTWEGLDFFYKKLSELNLPFLESQGNFVLFDTKRDSSLVNVALLKKGVIMRPVGNYGMRTHMRLSVGLAHENEIAMRALREVLSEIPEEK